MSYETTFATSVVVKDKGKLKTAPPPVIQKKHVTNDVVGANVELIEFDEKETSADTGRWGWLPPKTFDISNVLNGSKTLEFVSISADGYTYADCGEERPGVAILVAGEVVPLTAQRVFIDQPATILSKFKKFQVSVATGMFDCSKRNDEKLTVSITYGFSDESTPPGRLVDINAFLDSAQIDRDEAKSPIEEAEKMDLLNSIQHSMDKLGAWKDGAIDLSGAKELLLDSIGMQKLKEELMQVTFDPAGGYFNPVFADLNRRDAVQDLLTDAFKTRLQAALTAKKPRLASRDVEPIEKAKLEKLKELKAAIKLAIDQ